MLRSVALAMGAAFAAADAPSQFHIAIAPNGMRVAFKMNQTSTPVMCNYGTSPSKLNSTVMTELPRQYLADHGWHHYALLSPLTPSTKYYYSCAGSQPTAFVSGPQLGSTAEFNAVIFGDWGWLGTAERGSTLSIGGLQTNWSAVPARQLLDKLKHNGSADIVWHVGDLSYADDAFGYWADVLRFEYENVYDAWMEWIENVSSTTPYHSAPGNHESECHSPACFVELAAKGEPLRNFSAYNARWAHMPSAESGGVGPMWYSFDYGSVHFTSIDTSTDFPDAPEGTTGDSHSPLLPAGGFAPDGAYAAWVEADLAKAAANPAIRWIVAGGHRPFDDLPAAHASYLSGLFAKYGVAMYFAGHVHSYKRDDASVWGDSAPHITVGGAGCDEMPYPSDQLSPTPYEVADVAARATTHKDLHAQRALGAQRCQAWCSRPDVRAAYAQRNAPLAAPLPGTSPEALAALAAMPPRKAPVDPCKYCRTGPNKDTAPVAISDKMSMGVLRVTHDALTWELLRGPDGLVLDTVTVTKA